MEVVPHLPAGVVSAVTVIAALVPLGGFLTIGLGARAAGIAEWVRLGLYTAAGLACWGGVVAGLALLDVGWGSPHRWTPVFELVAFLLPPIAGVLALRRAPRLRAALAHRSGMWRLVSLQICRNLGVAFLVLHAQRTLPGLFAYPAAWGDIAVGVTAPVAMWAVWFRESEVKRPGSPWRTAFIAWNLMGLADHIVAVTMGTTHYPGVTQIFTGHPSTIVFAALPMLLFPTYMVSFADLAHLVTLDVLRRPRIAVARAKRRAPTPARPPVLAPR